MKRVAHRSQPEFNLPATPLLVVLSGPSGVGKDAVLTRMKKAGYPFKFIVTLTTRPRRTGEKDNIDYHFVPEKKFKEMIGNNELLEWANVYGNWYGVPKAEVKQALEQGQDVMVKVDTQGAANIKKILPEAVSIFLMPPSMEELILRLKRRHTESDSELDLRLKTAEEEVKQLHLFDYVVVNRWDKVNLAVSEIKAIVAAEKCRVNPRKVAL